MLIKDITALERVQRRPTKCILFDFNSECKSYFIAFNIFPLMMYYEIPL